MESKLINSQTAPQFVQVYVMTLGKVKNTYIIKLFMTGTLLGRQIFGSASFSVFIA